MTTDQRVVRTKVRILRGVTIADVPGYTPGDPVTDAILHALKVQGPLAQTAIRDLFSRHVKAERIARSLNQLAEAGLVVSEKAQTGGRPSTIWKAASTR